MPLPTGTTLEYIEVYDNPNEGRGKINRNFLALALGAISGISATLYTNSNPTTIEVGGIAEGTTFSGTYTIQEMFDFLLYPYATPTFSSFSISGQSSPVEVGTTISGTKTFSWATTNSSNVSANTITIRDVGNSTNLGTGLANDGMQSLPLMASIQKTSQSSHTWRITGYDSQGDSFTRDSIVYWYWKIYYGTSSSTTLTTGQITGLTSSVLGIDSDRTYSFAASNYKYIAVPNLSQFDITTIKDSSTGFNVAMADASDGYALTLNGINYTTVTVTNIFGVPLSYRLYRTKNILSSTIDIIVT